MSEPESDQRQQFQDSLIAWIHRPDPFHGAVIPPAAQRVRILGTYYLHFRPSAGGDLYITRFGLPYLEQLKLKNWRDDPWFQTHRERLKGTSTVYKVPSKEVTGRSINLVVKWSRVGEDVPLDTFTFNRFAEAEFNSPFEEFSLVMEMRESRVGPRLRTNRPLAIYVPPDQLQLWETGRSRSRIARKKSKNRDVELDILRQYILIYEWVEGVAADTALDPVILDREKREAEMERLSDQARNAMARKGYNVVDHKPAHVILRPGCNGGILRRRNGDVPYALVDFELLQRTPEHERAVEDARRHLYLAFQKTRFERTAEELPVPEHIRRVKLFNVDYIWGHAESTHGMLWVVGRNPELFDFFLPERWRHTPRTRLSPTAETYHTVSKDHINLVWKVSRVGETPDLEPNTPHAEEILKHGYNSPFEEFALAMELAAKGFSVVYPRALYRAGLESPRSLDYVTDHSRFHSHKSLRHPDGQPVLRPEHNYIILWGNWDGRIGEEGASGRAPFTGVDPGRAEREGLLSRDEQQRLLQRTVKRIEDAGFYAFLKASHFLLSRESSGALLREADGMPRVTISNFELIKRRP